VVLAPRGMLGEGALNQKSGKKKAFLLLAKFWGLYKGIHWHVSSNFEADEVRKNFGRHSIINIALNLSAPSSIRYVPRRKIPGELKAVYISRIASVKNLEGSLRVLSKLPPDCLVEYDIYGPLEDEVYWERCMQLIREMPTNIEVNYKGPVPNEEVAAKLASYHFGLMLTFNENFGHSIVETMIAGCPVIISDRTPWRALAEKNVGWDLSLEQESLIVETLARACRMDQMEYDQWSMAAYEYARFIIKNPEAVEQNRLLFA
jgi:glycosyltransferase involved in cell wall biosynthesis